MVAYFLQHSAMNSATCSFAEGKSICTQIIMGHTFLRHCFCEDFLCFIFTSILTQKFTDISPAKFCMHMVHYHHCILQKMRTITVASGVIVLVHQQAHVRVGYSNHCQCVMTQPSTISCSPPIVAVSYSK